MSRQITIFKWSPQAEPSVPTSSTETIQLSLWQSSFIGIWPNAQQEVSAPIFGMVAPQFTRVALYLRNYSLSMIWPISRLRSHQQKLNINKIFVCPTAWWPQVTAHLFFGCRPVVFTPAPTKVIIANTCPTFGAGVNEIKRWRCVSSQDLFTVSVQHWHGFKDTKNTCCTEFKELKLSCGNQWQRWGKRVNSVVTFFFWTGVVFRQAFRRKQTEAKWVKSGAGHCGHKGTVCVF